MQPASARRCVHVLLVDDHPDTREMYALALAFLGMDVRSRAAAPEALDAIGVERPDVVVTDLHLTGMSGLDLATRLRSDSATASVPVILLTGDIGDSLQAEAEAAGCAAVCMKPMLPDALADVITETLARVTPVRHEDDSAELPARHLRWAFPLPDPSDVVRPAAHPLLSRNGFLPAPTMPA